MSARTPKGKKSNTLMKSSLPAERLLLADVRQMILQARESVARAIDSGLTMLYWNVEVRIRKDILKEKRAEYGAEIVAALGRQLESEFGRGFGRRNLFRMIRFAEVFPDVKIVSALLTQLSWTHFLSIIPVVHCRVHCVTCSLCVQWSDHVNRLNFTAMPRDRLQNRS